MQRLLFFTKYTAKGPSSRYRTYQYLDFFKAEYNCQVYPFFDNKYIEILYSGKHVSVFRVIGYYIRRAWYLLCKVKRNDLVFVEYELFPYFFSIFEQYLKWRRIKYIVDFDDSIFHNYDKSNDSLIRFLLRNKIPDVMRCASYIITGSPYLTRFASKYNANVCEIPTSISLKKYEFTHPFVLDNNEFVLGWMGSKSTSVNLLLIKGALSEFSKKHTNIVIRFVGVEKAVADELGVCPVKWTEDDELRLLNSFSVGIMPLVNNDFNKGKCGFKLIQYMACGKPTISTPLEANIKINRNKKNLHATTNEEWLQALEQIYNNQSYFSNVGIENKKDIARYYSIEENQTIYKSIFKELFRYVG